MEVKLEWVEQDRIADKVNVTLVWKNLGGQSVFEAYADIDVFDEDGEKLDAGATDKCIFYSQSEATDVMPGESFSDDDEADFVVLSILEKVHCVEARITRLHSRSDPGVRVW